jgi:hypothetical protein
MQRSSRVAVIVSDLSYFNVFVRSRPQGHGASRLLGESKIIMIAFVLVRRSARRPVRFSGDEAYLICYLICRIYRQILSSGGWRYL